MSDIDIDAKTDRELLIIAVSKLNKSCEWQEKADKTIYGNGVPGLVFRVWALTFLIIILASTNPSVINFIAKVF